MSSAFVWSIRQITVLAIAAMCCQPAFGQAIRDPDTLLREAEQLAWLKAWTTAAPMYEEAARLYAARGDRRNALFAEINRLRGDLPRLAVPDVSLRLAQYLEDPLVQSDAALRLRCLVIKGETDQDLDPYLAQESWQEALQIAEQLGDAGWANRARGELGLVAFLLGDISTSVTRLAQAMTVAQASGDTVSLVRWLTLFGHGFVQLGRPQQALDYYDQALKTASTIQGLQIPVMTYLGKSTALVKLERFSEAEQLLNAALAVAEREGALGYQAALTLEQGTLAYQQARTGQALELFARAAELARAARGGRILAEIALELARIQRAENRPLDAEKTLQDGIAAARSMAEHFLLPRLLAQLADLRVSRKQYAEAGDLLEEAALLLEGLLTNVSSPWVRSRVIGGMNDVFLARIRLEAAHEPNPSRAFAVVEQARGRSLLELLLSTPVANVKKSPELRTGEREIAALQVQLLRVKSRTQRQRLLDQIFLAEARLGAVSTELFNRTRTVPRRPLTLRDVQRALRPDEVFLEFALVDPESYCVVVTRSSVRLQLLSGRAAIESRIAPLLKAVREERDHETEARRAGEILLDQIPELAERPRVIVSPDGDLHQLPFELLVTASGARLLQTHIVSYVPSGSVLAILRNRQAQRAPSRAALAISASPTAQAPVEGSDGRPIAAGGSIPRGVYDLDIASLPALPSANAEAQSVGDIVGSSTSTVCLERPRPSWQSRDNRSRTSTSCILPCTALSARRCRHGRRCC